MGWSESARDATAFKDISLAWRPGNGCQPHLPRRPLRGRHLSSLLCECEACRLMPLGACVSPRATAGLGDSATCPVQGSPGPEPGLTAHPAHHHGSEPFLLLEGAGQEGGGLCGIRPALPQAATPQESGLTHRHTEGPWGSGSSPPAAAADSEKPLRSRESGSGAGSACRNLPSMPLPCCFHLGGPKDRNIPTHKQTRCLLGGVPSPPLCRPHRTSPSSQPGSGGTPRGPDRHLPWAPPAAHHCQTSPRSLVPRGQPHTTLPDRPQSRLPGTVLSSRGTWNVRVLFKLILRLLPQGTTSTVGTRRVEGRPASRGAAVSLLPHQQL